MLVTIIGIILGLLIGGGVGYLVYSKTDEVSNAVLAGTILFGVIFMLAWLAPRLCK